MEQYTITVVRFAGILKATQLELGLLVNFGHYLKIEYERVICQKDRYAST